MGTPVPIVIASCDDATCVRSTGAEAILQVHGELMDAIGKDTRVYLALEKVRGTFDAAVLRVYLRTSTSADEVYLGSIALFGLRKASSPDAGGASAGMQSILDITPQARQFGWETLPADAQLHLSIRAHHALPDGVEIAIERICVCISPG